LHVSNEKDVCKITGSVVPLGGLLSGAALAVLLGIWAAGRGEAPINEKEKNAKRKTAEPSWAGAAASGSEHFIKLLLPASKH
jgi:hypothetical protein